MPKVDNPKLYEEVKKYVDSIYKKPSAYKSGFLVKKYKELGGTYSDDDKEKQLKRWFSESWKNVANKQQYPVLRPSIIVNKNTPLTIQEIDPKNLQDQIRLKQKLRGKYLPPFKGV
jgi:hypothetical protein